MDSNSIKFYTLLILTIFANPIFPDSVHTRLTDPADIEAFDKVTTKIRCICLPSLPIKSCSFNNCMVSAQLKEFFENRILAKEDPDTIIQKTVKGFGETIKVDPVVQKLIHSGNQGMVNGIINGFGESILAEPPSMPINLTLLVFSVLSITGIFYYLRKKAVKAEKVPPITVRQVEDKTSLDKYLGEVKDGQR